MTTPARKAAPQSYPSLLVPESQCTIRTFKSLAGSYIHPWAGLSELVHKRNQSQSQAPSTFARPWRDPSYSRYEDGDRPLARRS